ncbi:PREDICTED: uncharacterized protein LOC109582922 [Amphimedon queenslandica]|uniref:Non-specific protein-tyrosine kinase n=1 Tax=Amphimedon queenslandica TaxID=400682 RepID=A0AAN0JA12_AMPQE|nr:PREDICTED: uncharacterized protein LOC109582922 [Amphimedon queenslandica]|eukprot:XP_019853548.1 PREDICTED: uncharacterized protein LOC109582922 [Amphimedon queenslandica]
MLLNVFIKLGPNSSTVAIEVEPSDTVKKVKKKIAEKESLLADKLQILTIDNKELQDSDVLQDHSIENEATVICTVSQSTLLLNQSSEPHQVFVEIFSTEVLAVPVVISEASVSDIKRKITFQSRFATPLLSEYSYNVAFANESLDDLQSLSHYNIEYGATLRLEWSPIQIVVKTDSGRTISLDVLPIDNVGRVKTIIEDKLAIPFKKQEVLFDGTLLEDNDTLFRCGINKGGQLQLHYLVTIHIKALTGANYPSLEMMTPVSVEAIKENIQPKDQNLYFAGQLVRDGGIFFCEYEADEIVFQLSRYSVTFTSKKGLCTQCNEAIEIGDGVVLANCSHLLCRLCMDKSVKIKDGECILCKKVLSPLEICSVLNDDELIIKNFPYRFYCKSEGCTASCFFEDKIDEFCCYRCAHANCIVCRVQHEEMNCKEYQNMIGAPNNVAFRAAVNKIISLLKDGSAIHCPSCTTVLVKKYGCNWIRCLICKMELYIQHTDSNESVSLLHKGMVSIYEEDIMRLSKSYNELLNAFEARRISFLEERDELRGMVMFQDDGIQRLQAENRSLKKTIEDKDALMQVGQSIPSMEQLALNPVIVEEGSQSDTIKRLKDRNNLLCDAVCQSNIKIDILEREKNQKTTELAEAQEVKKLVEAEFVRLLRARQQDNEENVRLRHQLRESSQKPNDTPNWQFSHRDVTQSEKELGRGAFGTVFVGKFRGQSVAVKQLHKVLQSPENINKMNREIDILSQLRHPNIVQFIGAIFDHPDGDPLIITELMDTSLREAYEGKKLTPNPSCRPVILSIMHDVAVGLNYLHTLPIDNIVHRDVSSANVLLESKGPGKWKTKISDFGSANIVRCAVSRAPGAEVYSAPECFQSVTNQYSALQTPKMDVYSYGVLFCEALTCKFPDRSSFQDMLQQVWSSTKSVGLITRSLHHELIKSCTKDNPYKRPTMNEVISKLDQLLASH